MSAYQGKISPINIRKIRPNLNLALSARKTNT